MTPEQIESLIEHKLAEIMEVCDTVQISVTIQRDNVTECLHKGAGNFYARLASTREFVERQDEYIREDARRRASDLD
jgi:ABC-type uncharacterized transport system ATPase subunit